MKTSEKMVLGIIILAFAAAMYFEPVMPEKMASHWNAGGNVDGYMPKFLGVYLMPIILVGIFALFWFIPQIGPLKKNIAKFRQHFDNFLVLISLFLFYVYGLTLAWNLGYEYNMTMAILPAMSVLIYYSGVLMEKSKRNWFIGFRNPWTLSSDKVWAKTNKMGGKLFKFVAIASLIGIAFENYYVYIFIAPLLIGVVYLTIYSYLEYKKEKG